MVAGPERDASFRRDEHEPPVRPIVADGPRRHHDKRAGDERDGRPREAAGAATTTTRTAGRRAWRAGPEWRRRTQHASERAHGPPTLGSLMLACEIDGTLQGERRPDRDGRVQRLGEHVGRDPDERWIDRREPGRDDARTRSSRAHRRDGDEPHGDRADDRLHDLDADGRSGGRRRAARRSTRGKPGIQERARTAPSCRWPVRCR